MAQSLARSMAQSLAQGLEETEDSAYMSVREFAHHLGVSTRTVYRMVREGTLVALRVGRQWRIDAGQSIEWLAEDGYANETEAI